MPLAHGQADRCQFQTASSASPGSGQNPGPSPVAGRLSRQWGCMWSSQDNLEGTKGDGMGVGAGGGRDWTAKSTSLLEKNLGVGCSKAPGGELGEPTYLAKSGERAMTCWNSERLMVPSRSMSDSSRIWGWGGALDRSSSCKCHQCPNTHIVNELFHLGVAELRVSALAREAVHQLAQIFPVQGPVVIEVCGREIHGIPSLPSTISETTPSG